MTLSDVPYYLLLSLVASLVASLVMACLGHWLESTIHNRRNSSALVRWLFNSVVLLFQICLLPIVIVFSPVAAVVAGLRWLVASLRPPTPLQPLDPPERLAVDFLRVESGVEKHMTPSPRRQADEHPPKPQFGTVRVDLSTTDSDLIVTVRFLLNNVSEFQLVLDDAHVRIYERMIRRRAALDVTYKGGLHLLKSNRIQKRAGVDYSVDSASAGEWDLNFKMTKGEDAGRFVFGVLIDYYYVSPGRIIRGTIPSNAIYLLVCNAHAPIRIGVSRAGANLSALDAGAFGHLRARWKKRRAHLEYLDQLQSLLERHRRFDS